MSLSFVCQVKIRHKRIGDDFIPYITKTDVSSKELSLVDGLVPLGNGRVCDHETTANGYEEDDDDDDEEDDDYDGGGKNGKEKKGDWVILRIRGSSSAKSSQQESMFTHPLNHPNNNCISQND